MQIRGVFLHDTGDLGVGHAGKKEHPGIGKVIAAKDKVGVPQGPFVADIPQEAAYGNRCIELLGLFQQPGCFAVGHGPRTDGIGELNATQANGIGLFVPGQHELRRPVQVAVHPDALDGKFLPLEFYIKFIIVIAWSQADVDDLFHERLPAY